MVHSSATSVFAARRASALMLLLPGLAVGAAQIQLDTTVGTVLDPAVCATASAIAVEAGTQVQFCYTVTNTGSQLLRYHDLSDSFGPVLVNQTLELAPGESTRATARRVIFSAVVNPATWSSRASLPYAVATSAQPGGPAYAFVDIAATGTPLSLFDDAEFNVALPFLFSFNGVVSDQLRVANNGAVLFGVTQGDADYENLALPAPAIGNALLPFWDDLSDQAGNVYYEVRGAAPQRKAIIQWHQRPHFEDPPPASPNGVTFQVILSEEDGSIVFQYADVDFGNAAWNNGASATVGLSFGPVAVPFAFNQPVVGSGLAIRFTPITPDQAVSTDAAAVVAQSPKMTLNAQRVDFGLLPGQAAQKTLTIGNVGDASFSWNLSETVSAATPVTPPGHRSPVLARAVRDVPEKERRHPLQCRWRGAPTRSSPTLSICAAAISCRSTWPRPR
ncbi:hypothetical protein [Tahibacter amnicola]|uniref:Choice-of-anchor D domain-containing protein n=1 Tax=Tahibacter amnicola TaxID=2976241 RepID=A0ABY6BC22_9GAMM|nr:hypothetical protein [Tahibacter amnicola]UXI67596.1 hypothetical protein N4264_23120 [Tahibacter amnicola]